MRSGTGWQIRITFGVGDLLEPLTGPVDIIIANPPYIPAENLPELQAEIRDHEPRVAVDGGDGGYDDCRTAGSQRPQLI